MGPRMREDKGEGEGGSRTCPYRWWWLGSWRERAGLKPAPTQKGLSVGGVGKMDSCLRLHGGRLSAGTAEAGARG